MGVELKELLKAGVHFGHQTHRWNPKMRKYIFAESGGIYLIDLKKTQRELQRAHDLVRETVIAGKSILFVCTKPQLARVVRGEAERSGSFYVTERWLGGMLTNFQTIKKNIARLKELERGAEEGAFEFYTKKERLLLEREREKLDRYLSGIKDMTRLPGLVFVVDSTREEIAVREANRLGIPVVAIADTNADPDLLTIAIAGNDDAIRSVSLITRSIADVVEAARRETPDIGREEKEAQAYTYSSDAGGVADTAAAGASRRRRPRRKPRPEVIAQRLHHPEVIEAPEEKGSDEEASGADASDAERSDAEAPEAAEPAAASEDAGAADEGASGGK
ncbi:30S ribosomal protein S2 [Candidatus Palauibacter sp.]|uniref:30S ribosomal protein S2 n=1 Tax=Candidatus Palauibacter sp. TaxID=3101350 RepID=UPI003B01D1A8